LKISFVYGFDAFMMLFEKSYIFSFTYIISESFQDAFAFRLLMLSFGQKISTKSKELRCDIFISEERLSNASDDCGDFDAEFILCTEKYPSV